MASIIRIAFAIVPLLALVALTSAQPSTLCEFPRSLVVNQLYDLATFKKCAYSIPFNASYAKATLATVRAATDAYVFRDIVRNSPLSPLVHLQVNLADTINSLAKTKFTTAWDFEQALVEAYTVLRDPHTLYRKPSCYGAFAIQPFSLLARWDQQAQKQIIFISKVFDIMANFSVYNGLGLNDFVGANIDLINGIDALTAIASFSRATGYVSKDYGALFNSALQTDFQQRYLRMATFPNTTAQTYSVTLPNGTAASITIPWYILALSSLNYTGGQCATFNPPPPMVPTRESIRFDENVFFPHRILADVAPAEAEHIEIYNVSDSVIALKIRDFEYNDREAFMTVVNNLLIQAHAQNITKLIVDVIGNGGGDICVGYKVVHRLLQERYPEGSYDIIHSKLANSLIQTTSDENRTDIDLFSPEFWYNSKRQPYNDSSWYNPGIHHTRGGVKGTYSVRTFHACDFIENYPRHNFTKILVISDGLCGSTCAVFTTHLDEVDKVETLAMGGLYPQPMQYFSFPGGEVVDMDFIAYVVEALALNGSLPGVPPPLPADSTFRWAMLEIYPWLHGLAKLPLEFLYRPAQNRVPIWVPPTLSDSDLLNLYLEIAKRFEAPQ